MKTQDATPFHLEPAQSGFESLAQSDGFKFWWASDLARLLGYQGLDSFRKAVNKAMIVCDGLGVPLVDNFVQERRVVDGREQLDFRLSRFACYLTAMNGNVNNPLVAQAQACFVTFAEACRLHLERAENVERVGLRAEISDREKSLSGVAKDAGVRDYGLFQNAVYRGVYNMDLAKLRDLKCVPPDRSPLDFMAKEELAGNQFRVTQTEAKICKERRCGQSALESAAEEAGRRVRQADLEKRGHDVWSDKNEIKFGDDWRRAITDGIVGSNRVLSFLSKHSIRDPGVRCDEIAIAIDVKGGNSQTLLVESEQDVRPPVDIGHRRSRAGCRTRLRSRSRRLKGRGWRPAEDKAGIEATDKDADHPEHRPRLDFL